ncbi:hypothetical protein LJC60_06665 [Ruminococcaceae bacterium OttesenSCG-928-D13]|nr:hypothetical protein [Ruminococcaceae bacterium OttesenSCG-928-D13]
MIEYIWTKIGKRLIQHFENKITGKVVKHIDKKRLKKCKVDFITSLESKLLHNYGDYAFYNKLSRCLIVGDVLDVVFDYCYDRMTTRFSSDDEMLDYILKREKWRASEYGEVKKIVQDIIDSTFYALNKSENDSERKLANFALRGEELVKAESASIRESIETIKIDNSAIEIGTKENKELLEEIRDLLKTNPTHSLAPISPEAADNILPYAYVASDKYDVSLRARDPKDNFQIDIVAKYCGDLVHHTNMRSYLDYLTFSGCPGHIEVYSLQERDGLGNVLQSYVDESYTGPTMKLETMSAPERITTISKKKPDGYPDGFDGMILEIVPPVTEWNVDIINQDFDVLIPNLKLGMKRKLSNDKKKLETTLEDTETNNNVSVSFKYTFENGVLAHSSFNVKIKNPDDFVTRLSYFKLLAQMSRARTLMYRDVNTGEIISRAAPKINQEEVSALEYNIDLCKKILAVQDHFNVRFSYTDKPLSDDVTWIGYLYNMITQGYSIMENPNLVISKEDAETNHSLSLDNKYLFYVGLSDIEIWDARIEFAPNADVIMAKASIQELPDNGGIKIIPESKTVILYRPTWGDYDIQDIGRKVLSEELFSKQA